MSSKVTIWNMAAAIAGGNNKGLITGENDRSDIANYCREFYEDAVDISVIFSRSYRGKGYKDISATSDTVDKADWTYAFRLPADYLEMIRFTDEDGRGIDYDHDIVMQTDANGSSNAYIVSDEQDCYIQYWKKIDYNNAVAMGAYLRRLVAANLAVLIAPFYKPKMLPVAEQQLAKWEQRVSDMNSDHEYIEEIESAAEIQ